MTEVDERQLHMHCESFTEYLRFCTLRKPHFGTELRIEYLQIFSKSSIRTFLNLFAIGGDIDESVAKFFQSHTCVAGV